MKLTAFHRTTISAAAVIVVIAGAAAYRGWDDGRRVPLLGDLFGAPPADPDHTGHEMSAMPAPEPAGTSEPRGPVTLDLRRQQLVGVRLATAEREALSHTVRTVGTVRYDETRLADVNLQLEGWIRELYADYTGRFVRKGEPLFTLYSPALLATQQEYLLALRSRDQLRQSQIADVRERAERLVEAARQRLALWDIPDDLIRTLDETREPQTTVTFRSPVAGYVIEKQAVQGAHVAPGDTLYRIADLSRVWVEADIYEQEMPLVRVGQSAEVTLGAYPGERFTGRIVYIYPFVEENTRTVRVRFEFANRDGRLKPGMFANVALETPIGASTTIPANALLDSGTRQIVFVAEGDGYFQPRDVTVGHRAGGRVQILEGLEPGEQVAEGATFFLDSESQLRAAVEGFEGAPRASGGQAASPAERLEIAFTSAPNPPRTGDNDVEVSVTDASGRPITDAEVSVTFFMAAMPSMNMPAMKSDATLRPAGGGVYRGSAQVLMGGRWDVTVHVSRDGEHLASRQFAVVAR